MHLRICGIFLRKNLQREKEENILTASQLTIPCFYKRSGNTRIRTVADLYHAAICKPRHMSGSELAPELVFHASRMGTSHHGIIDSCQWDSELNVKGDVPPRCGVTTRDSDEAC